MYVEEPELRQRFGESYVALQPGVTLAATPRPRDVIGPPRVRPAWLVRAWSLPAIVFGTFLVAAVG